MQRVLIIGCPGAGKSTVARQLAAHIGLPLIHLDRHYWQPGWVAQSKEVWEITVNNLIASPQWIIDGNYGGTLSVRAQRADTVIHLDFPTWLCLWRVLARTLRGHGQVRGDEFVEGCPERFDLSFIRFVWRYRRVHRGRDLARLADFKGTLISFKRPGQLRYFLETM